MTTPIYDFMAKYAKSKTTRFHMPGHKGISAKNSIKFLGCENLDITEIKGADSLYEADSIIAESEANASELFGTGATFYSTEGSSQCIRAMLSLAISTSTNRSVLAARNVHKSFVYAAGLIGFDVEWFAPEMSDSLCRCRITADKLAKKLDSLKELPAAFYLTSPDYLGGVADIKSLAEVCHERGILLLVDNAHGAYLRFLPESSHPIELGADLCCDSAHKTLPVLTGGAYLHLSESVSDKLSPLAKSTMEIFGSTSPSYLTLGSLDLCNFYLASQFRGDLADLLIRLRKVREALAQNGWILEESDPLRLTLRAPDGMTGNSLAELLRSGGIECEYSDLTFVVLMVTPMNDPGDFQRLIDTLGINSREYSQSKPTKITIPERKMSIRDALFAPHEFVPAEKSLGRVCGAPTVSCPPAIPIAVSGEIIDDFAIELFKRYGTDSVEVVCG